MFGLKEIKRIIKTITIFSVLTQVGYAFFDDFNDGEAGDWTLTGSWSFSNASPSADGTIYAQGSGNVNMYHTISESKYWSTYIYGSSGYTSYENSARFYFNANSTHANFIYYRNLAGSITISGSGFTYNPVGISNGLWYRIVIQLSGNNYLINIYNDTNALINTQTAPITQTIVDPDRIVLLVSQGGIISMTGRFDNVTANPYNLRGYVIDTISGDPVSGATVSIATVPTATTDANGYWESYLITNGAFSYSISKTGYVTLSGSQYFEGS